MTSYRGLRIRAERDDTCENPFEDWDGHFPMATYYDGSWRDYDKTKGCAVRDPLLRFEAQHLVFDQKALADALTGLSIERLIYDEYGEENVKWCTDPNLLYGAFSAYEDNENEGKIEALYELLGIKTLVHTSRGYCQGDWAKVLIVATPEAMDEFGWTPEQRADEAFVKQQLESQAKLYDAWAWGDVYGYIVERVTEDEDGEEEVEELDSCWSFFGDDFEWSGLDDAAFEAAEAHAEETVDA